MTWHLGDTLQHPPHKLLFFIFLRHLSHLLPLSSRFSDLGLSSADIWREFSSVAVLQAKPTDFLGVEANVSNKSNYQKIVCTLDTM